MRITVVIEVTEGPDATNVAPILARAIAELDMTDSDFDVDTVFIAEVLA